MSIGIVHHVCIQTGDYRASVNFYINILGFEMVKETRDFHDRDFNAWLRLGSFMIELQTSRKSEKLAEYDPLSMGIAHICFMVDSVHGEYERIRKLGYDNFKDKNGEHVYYVGDTCLMKIVAPEGTIIEMRESMDL